MVDSFFVNPTKRRKTTSGGGIGNKKSRVNGRVNGEERNGSRGKKRAQEEDKVDNDIDEGLESEDLDSDNLNDEDMEIDENDSDDEFGFETEADKRRRLAKQYLENIQSEITGELDDNAFDAKDLDREIISRRLKEDVAETKGKIYRFLSNYLSTTNVNTELIQVKSYGLTSISSNYPFAFTTSKDLTIMKWDISNASKPRIVKFVKGNYKVKSKSQEERESYKGHFDEILCIAVSPNGKFIATGGKDKRIVIWSSDLLPIKVFETRDRKGLVMGLAFRRNTNELYASCADLKVRTFNLDQLAQVEILFGHQDEVCDISALGQERCVSVGSRDRTAIIWKINEETRLTFRGIDTAIDTSKNRNNSYESYSETNKILEGSIDCCSMIDDQLFVTGSDNGNICLWSTNKKKPLFVHREGHGRDEPLPAEKVTAESSSSVTVPPPPALPRYITSIYAIPFSDIFFTGSWDGQIKMWKINEDLRSFEHVGAIPGANGIVNRISIVESGPKNKESFTITAAISKELRLGRWLKVKGKNGLFTAVINRT